MNLPKWEMPAWVNLTPEKIKSMSEVEVRSMLKGAMQHVKSMPDDIPCKPYMIQLGNIALKINERAIKLEKGVGVEDDEEQLKREIDQLHEKAIVLMMKIATMQKDPLSFIHKIVEISEQFEEDPWKTGETYQPEPVPPIQLNPVEDFDPWATANDF